MRNVLDRELWQQHDLLCGVDEVGRGALAGPVVAAAVVLPPGTILRGVNDSKLLSPERRAHLFEQIAARALSWAVGMVNHREIDRLNISRASFVAMKKAVEKLTLRPDFIVVDGFRIPGLARPHVGVIRGDQQSLTIAAASIIAKVTRDQLMARFHSCFPDYRFDQNKGYGVPDHLAALHRIGASPIHRRSFAPVRAACGLFASVNWTRSAEYRTRGGIDAPRPA